MKISSSLSVLSGTGINLLTSAVAEYQHDLRWISEVLHTIRVSALSLPGRSIHYGHNNRGCNCAGSCLEHVGTVGISIV